MIARLICDQRGLTIIELLISMVIMTIVFGATTTTFIALQDEHVKTEEHNDAQDKARTAVDRLARELRNLASPTALTNVRENRPRAVEAVGPYDFVFRVVDDTMPGGSANNANVKRVRYCLDASNPQSGILVRQQQTWTTAVPPAMPATGACPSADWGPGTSIASEISNVIDPARPRPVFSFDSTDIEKVTRVHTELFIDPTPLRRPVEAQLASGVVLRNQNQFPKAAFEVSIIGTQGTNRIIRLDGSSSTDPESQGLTYCWLVDPPTPTPDCALTPKPSSYVGEGVVFTYSMPQGSHRVVLRVEDPAGLRDDAEDRRNY